MVSGFRFELGSDTGCPPGFGLKQTAYGARKSGGSIANLPTELVARVLSLSSQGPPRV